MSALRPRLPGAMFWVPGILGLGVVLSVALFVHLRNRERQDATDAAADLARQQTERLRISILRSMEVLHSIDAFHAAGETFGRQNFQAFVRSALSRQPELQALSWNPVVPGEKRAVLESNARDEGLTDFTFLAAAPGGGLEPSPPRPEYVPVYYIEPYASNRDALGYDLASDPNRRESLERARDTGVAVATAPIRLAQGPGHSSGFLVLLPVYVGPEPAEVLARRRQIDGFAVAVFRIDALVGGAFRELARSGLRAELFDDSQSGEPERLFTLWPSEPPLRAGSTACLEVAGRRWTAVFTPMPGFPGAQHTPTLVLAIGLAFTLSTCAYVFHAGLRSRQVSRANSALQAEVIVRQRAEASAAAANKAKSDFLTSISHEIRTPLNAILGYTQLMRRDPDLSPEQRDATLGIQTSGQHLLGLINEVLDLARIEAGRMELVPSDFDLARLAGSIATTFRPLCFQKRLRFRLVLESSSPHYVHGDEVKLRQILINLVGNAIKFTRVGEVQLRIRAAGTADHWLVEVLDTGLGIPDSERPDIFKPFHQGAGAAHQGGTGLGLAIAQRQVQLLGGSLQYQSERGVGSRFFFSIPLASLGKREPKASCDDMAMEDGFPPPEPEPCPVFASASVGLPRDLLTRLTLAAELHSSTALKACLPELPEHGQDAARFAEELRWLLRSYDMQGVQRALSRVHVSESSA